MLLNYRILFVRNTVEMAGGVIYDPRLATLRLSLSFFTKFFKISINIFTALIIFHVVGWRTNNKKKPYDSTSG